MTALTQTIGHATRLRVERPWNKIHNAPIRATVTDCDEEFLSATVDNSPCDGSHGRFCPECAHIERMRRLNFPDPEDVLSPLPASRRTRSADL